MSTTLDLAGVEHLDWQPPCEHSQHHRHPGDEPAALLVQYTACVCGEPGGELLLCRPAWERCQRITCRDCGATYARDDVWTVLATVGGGG